MLKQFLLASDFDQTLSFNDSGVVLSELIGFSGFHDKVAGLSQMNLVQQGAELSYLILHDPEFRRVRRDDLIATGKRIRLKHDVALFARALDNLADEYRSEEHTSELQSHSDLVCRLLLEKKKQNAHPILFQPVPVAFIVLLLAFPSRSAAPSRT